MRNLTVGLMAYRLLSRAATPLAPVLLRQRMLRGKEDPGRMSERLGYTTLPRPDGTLIWIHGASVGESLAALPLIETLIGKPDRRVLLTSGTVSSAQVLRQRLPPGVLHQFAVVDTPAAVTRFLDHWRPQLALFVDSEIWPNALIEAKRRNVLLVLVNGRMSERSFTSWLRARRSARVLMSAYDLCLVQDARTEERLRLLGATRVKISGGLKADAPALPADPIALESLQQAINGRPVFLAAQTHPGEEATIFAVHDHLSQTFPELLTIVVPRHPERGAELLALSGLRPTARRAAGELPRRNSAIYLADTMGELGLFYRVARLAFIGGSLVPHGGQNPLEPARLGCPVLAGPHTENFSDAYGTVFAMQELGRVDDASAICALATPFLADARYAEQVGARAKAGAHSLGGAVKLTTQAIENALREAGLDARP
jgi:3-deoxy-D-manno-octulosonic-acid transferase